MTTRPHPPSLPLGSVSRSLGLKLIVLLALIVLMAVPVMFISFINFERLSRADEVSHEVSQTYGGEQRLLGPVIVVPYRETLPNGGIREGDYILSALTGEAVLNGITVEEKTRSLYKVPIYTAEATLSATLPSLGEVLPQQAGLSFDINRAKVIVGVGDVTGLISDASLNTGGRTYTFEPYSGSARFSSPDRMFVEREAAIDPVQTQSTTPPVIYDRLNSGGMTLLSVPISEFVSDADMTVTARMAFTGQSAFHSSYAKVRFCG